MEFFLFERRPDRSLLPLQPHDNAGYFDVSTDFSHSIRRQMVDALMSMGINVETSHHETAIGQSEIDFRFGTGIDRGRQRHHLPHHAQGHRPENNLHCTFMPKPITGIAGSGMHVHQSLWRKDSGETAMYDAANEYGLSQTALQFIAGQLARAGNDADLGPLGQQL